MAAGQPKGGPRPRRPATRRTPSPKAERDAALAAFAARHENVVSDEDLSQLGFTRAATRHLLDHHFLHRRYPGVYAFGSHRLNPAGALRAALLAGGDGAWLSHRTCAGRTGLRALNLIQLEITVPGSARTQPRGLTIHRSRSEPHPGEVIVRDGLRMSSFPRMMVELAAGEDAEELERLLHQAARRGLLDLQGLEEASDRHRRRPGLETLRAVAAAYLPRHPDASELERDFEALRAARPNLPEPQRNVRIGGWEIDCWFPEQRLAVELDGRPYHVAVSDLERDRLKDAKLMRRGIRVLRITDRRLRHDPQGALDDLATLLARADAA